MAIRPSVLVNIDRPRQLRYSTNGLIAAQELTNIDIMSVNMGAKNISFPIMRAVIFAALWEDDDKITLRKAGELADQYDDGVFGLFLKASEAISLAFDGGDEKNAKRPETAELKAESEEA